MKAHEHAWQFSATSNKLEAYCTNEGCDQYAKNYNEAKATNKLLTLTLTAKDGYYTGAMHQDWADFGSSTQTDEYKAWKAAIKDRLIRSYDAKAGSALTNGWAVNVGSYTAKLILEVGTESYIATADFTPRRTSPSTASP